jgi:hypothetical protein
MEPHYLGLMKSYSTMCAFSAHETAISGANYPFKNLLYQKQTTHLTALPGANYSAQGTTHKLAIHGADYSAHGSALAGADHSVHGSALLS